jgi:serine/threonine protein kinase
LNLLITQVLEGLSYLHDQGLVHSDLKLSNVLLKKEGTELTFKIGDLFTLKNDPSPFTINGGFFTPEITSPEVYKLKVITAKADIWSFGVMLYILFTGQYPFGERRKITVKEVKRNVKKNLIIGPSLEQIISPYNDFIALCLNPDPQKRPTANDLLKMIS